MIVADSTVLLPLVAQVPQSAQAAALLERGEALAAPQAALTETLAAARKLVQLGHMLPDDAHLAAEVLPPLLAAIVPDTGLLPQAMALAGEHDLPLPAALCLELARSRGWPLATFDEELKKIAAYLSIADALSES